MKRSLFILCLLMSIVLSACSHSYYSKMLQPDVQYAPCFGRDSVPDYMRESQNNDEVNYALALTNKNLVNHIFPFLFRETVPVGPLNTPELVAQALQCSSNPRIEDNDVRAYINVVTQPPKKEPDKGKESAPAVAAQKETITAEEICEPFTKGPKDHDKKEAVTKKHNELAKKESAEEVVCAKITTTTTKEAGPVEKESPNRDQEALLTQDINLVISTYLYSLNRADRLEKAYTLVIPLHAGVSFVKIDSPMADKTVAFGTESFKYGLSTSSGIPVGSSLGSPVSLTPSIEKNIQRNISKHYILRNAQIFPMRNIIMISQDGGPAEADIGGNSEVAATIKIPADLCQYITVYSIVEPPAKKETAEKPKPECKPKPSEKPKHIKVPSQDNPNCAKEVAAEKPKPAQPELHLKSSNICYIERVSALTASVSVARIVSLGKETVKEDDDVVTPKTFRNAAVIDLWKNPQALYQVELLKDNNSSRVVFDSPVLGALSSGLTFSSFQDAVTVRNLIAAKSDGLLKGIPVKVGEEDYIIISAKRDFSTPPSLDVRVCVAGTSTTFGRHDKCAE